MDFIRADEIRPDDRYYWVTANPDGSFSKIPKALEDKEEVDEKGNPLFVKVYDEATKTMVDSTERLVTKGLKSNYIAQIRQKADELEAAISAVTSVEELIALNLSFPSKEVI